LQTQLKEIEIESGRTKERITIDLDLMLYDHQRFHEKDWQRPYFTVLFDELPQIAE
jgi:7,8-dihydro-6-hydroxymethylpterin-pyrophosphokinase